MASRPPPASSPGHPRSPRPRYSGAEFDPASDIYSLGATLFCALTGHAAVERRSDERVIAQFLRITGPTIPEPRAEDIPDDVAAAIEHAMAVAPEDRPASAAELGEQLRGARRRHGLAVEEMALPATGSDQVAPVAARQREAAPPRLRVVLAEDDVLLREGLASLLDRSGSDVVGQVGNGVELVAMVREHTPELVVTDIRMPPTHATEGLDAVRVIREELPNTAILVLSAHDDLEHAMELLASGRDRLPAQEPGHRCGGLHRHRGAHRQGGLGGGSGAGGRVGRPGGAMTRWRR